MEGTVDTCFKNTLELNAKSKVFLSPKNLSDIIEGTGRGLNNDHTKPDNIITLG